MPHPPMSLLHSQINQGKFPFPPFPIPLNLHTRSPSPNQNINNSNFNVSNDDNESVFERKKENNNEANPESPVIKREVTENEDDSDDASTTELDLSVSGGRKRNGENCD